RQPSEMSCCLVWRQTNHRHLQASANNFRDVPDWYSFFCDRVVSGSCLPLLQGEPVETGRVEDVSCGPAVAPVAYVRGDAFFASHRYCIGDKALLDRVVNLRKAHN